MKALVTGVNGQLGYDLVKYLKEIGYKDYKEGSGENTFLALSHKDMDITDKKTVDEIVDTYNPDIIYHFAAYTNVDKAEEDKELCNLINVVGTKNITDASIRNNSKLIYTSSDYVFDGTKNEPYKEDDKPNPINYYGLTKYLGEEEVKRNPKSFIARISWVFGINGNNFIKTMLKLSENHKQLNVVADQIGSPTYTKDLAPLLVDMSYTDKYGIYNVTNEGFTSWSNFAKEIFKINDKDVKINEVTTKWYKENVSPNQANRPHNSRLDKTKLKENFYLLPDYKEAIKKYSKKLRRTK